MSSINVGPYMRSIIYCDLNERKVPNSSTSFVEHKVNTYI